MCGICFVIDRKENLDRLQVIFSLEPPLAISTSCPIFDHRHSLHMDLPSEPNAGAHSTTRKPNDLWL